MSKKKKTLKKKRQIDMKNTVLASDNDTQVEPKAFSLSHESSSLARSSPDTNQTPNGVFSGYVLQDLRTSIIISTILVLINIVIFILMKNSLIPLRFLGL